MCSMLNLVQIYSFKYITAYLLQKFILITMMQFVSIKTTCGRAIIRKVKYKFFSLQSYIHFYIFVTVEI